MHFEGSKVFFNLVLVFSSVFSGSYVFSCVSGLVLDGVGVTWSSSSSISPSSGVGVGVLVG